MENKIKFMKKALSLAKKSALEGEIPIGAVIVKDGKIIATGRNVRNSKKIATKHAEIIAIERACKKLKDWRLENAEMYVTVEPCPMCAGAILNSRIKKLYFGAYEKKSGAVLSNHRLLFLGTLNHTVDVEGGLLESECSSILKEFFILARKRQE